MKGIDTTGQNVIRGVRWKGRDTTGQNVIIIIIITYIYNALNDALSASRIHNKLKTILSKYIHIRNRQS